jgi:hypothetical protein
MRSWVVGKYHDGPRMVRMTPDERAQLIEDIDRSATIRDGIVEQARLSKNFDIAAAWQELDELDASIVRRVQRTAEPE